MKTGIVRLAVAVCALCIMGSAMAQGVELKPNYAVGDQWETTMNMEVAMRTPMGNQTMNQVRKLAVKVVEVKNNMPSVLQVTFGRDCTDNGQPAMVSGKTATLVRLGVGQVEVKGEMDEQTRQTIVGESTHLFPDNEAAMLPGKSVAVGDSWEPDMQALLQQIPGVDKATGKVSATLKGVRTLGDREVAQITTSGDLAADFQGQGKLSLKLSADNVVDRASGKTLEGVQKVAMVITVPNPEGGVVNIETDINGRFTTKVIKLGGAAGGGAGLNTGGVRNPLGGGDNPLGGGENPLGGGRNPLDGGDDAPAAFVGAFTDGNVTLNAVARGGEVTGVLEIRGNRYPITGKLAGNTITGKFTVEGSQYDFTATQDGNNVTLKSGARTYNLKKQASSNPLE